MADLQSGSSSTVSWSSWNLKINVGFCGEGKTLEAGTRTNNKLNLHKATTPGIETGPHWWEASALTTAASLRSLVFTFRTNQKAGTASKFSFIRSKDLGD